QEAVNPSPDRAGRRSAKQHEARRRQRTPRYAEEEQRSDAPAIRRPATGVGWIHSLSAHVPVASQTRPDTAARPPATKSTSAPSASLDARWASVSVSVCSVAPPSEAG